MPTVMPIDLTAIVAIVMGMLTVLIPIALRTAPGEVELGGGFLAKGLDQGLAVTHVGSWLAGRVDGIRDRSPD